MAGQEGHGLLLLPTMTIYSPSDTENWLKCPAYRDYNKRWHPWDNDWTPNRLLGEAIAGGLACYYKMLKRAHEECMGTSEVPDAVAFEDDAQAEAHALLTAGYVPQDTWTLDGLKKLVDRGLQVTLDAEPLPPNAQIVFVEEDMHCCRPDLVWRLPAGVYVHDWKVRYKLKHDYRDSTLSEFGCSWQLRHNAWAVERTLGEQVVGCSIGHITLTPKPEYNHYPVPMTPRRLKVWEETAHLTWERMAVDSTIRPPMNNKACWTFLTKDRRCPFYDACHVYDRDESLFHNLYVEVLK